MRTLPRTKAKKAEDLDRDVKGNDERPMHAIWGAFSRVKYWSSKTNGPREDGQRSDDLRRAAILLRDALEATWRAGFRGEDLMDELGKTLN